MKRLNQWYGPLPLHTLLVVVGVVGLLVGWPWSGARAQAPERFLVPSRYFAETGHNVGGNFLSFYEASGGPEMFGLPLTEVLEEQRTQVQYFERARLEIRPQQPGVVRVSPLGSWLSEGRAQEAAFVRHEAANPATSTFFPATGHNVSYAFRTFWEERGGHTLFGYPISEALMEYHEEDRAWYTVQYFERVRLEYRLEHPGGKQQVRLGNLGREYIAATGAVNEAALAPAPAIVRLGQSQVPFGAASGDMQNVRKAAQQFDGFRMLPGEQVSFLETVGELSADAGYVQGYGIVGGSVGQVIAGGICYVSTAMFQALLEAGLEIVERHPHSLALQGFSASGLDSAVYTPDQRYTSKSDVDLRWRNDMPYPVLIETEVITTGEVLVSLWGYSDGRETVIRDAVVDSSVTASPVWRYDQDLDVCEVRQVVHGNPGASVAVERVVTGADGAVLHQDYFSSHYAPLRDVFLYGPGVSPVDDVNVPHAAQTAQAACEAGR